MTDRKPPDEFPRPARRSAPSEEFRDDPAADDDGVDHASWRARRSPRPIPGGSGTAALIGVAALAIGGAFLFFFRKKNKP